MNDLFESLRPNLTQHSKSELRIEQVQGKPEAPVLLWDGSAPAFPGLQLQPMTDFGADLYAFLIKDLELGYWVYCFFFLGL